MHVAVEICRQLIKTYNILGGGGGGESLDFWNRGANNVLIWGGKNFFWSEISRSQRCHLQVMKFRVGDISGLQYLTPSHFLSIKVFF